MKYDFDSIINRKNTNCLKWDLFDTKLPMWVADMDFKVAPEISGEIINKANENLYGYAIIPDEWYDAYINWWKYYGLNMDKNNLKFANGVMPAIATIIRKLTKENDKILIQTPVYHVFFYVIEDNNREIVENQLVYKNGSYEIDFKDLEKKLADENVTLMMLCNPHNPVGKIWSRKDLEKIADLCAKYDVNIISDEIHCDLTDPDKKYIPFASISNYDSVTTVSPTKSFNIAGLNTAAVYIVGDKLKEDIFNALDVEWVSRANIFAITGAIAAYKNGRPWLDELRQYLYDNKKFVADFIKDEIPEIKLIDADATYLLWLDCSSLDISSKDFVKFLNEKTGVLLSAGVDFSKNSDEFLRLNIACPRKLLMDGLKAIKKGVAIYK